MTWTAPRPVRVRSKFKLSSSNAPWMRTATSLAPQMHLGRPSASRFQAVKQDGDAPPIVGQPPHFPPLQSIEWDMLLFFCGMFIMVEGAVELGLMRKIAAFITFIIDTAPVSAQKV